MKRPHLDEVIDDESMVELIQPQWNTIYSTVHQDINTKITSHEHPLKMGADQDNQHINRLTGQVHSPTYYALLKERKLLPCYQEKKKFVSLFESSAVMLLVGETGSGKTTQIPQLIIELGYGEKGRVACTQPRRVAAISVATRVSREMDVTLGNEVGYSIRFEDKTNHSTKLVYMTDGMLLREAMSDHMLSKYSVVIIDEAHERTLQTDILCGLLKRILRQRTDLKLVVMSATLESDTFIKFYDGPPLLEVKGRLFPVEIFYTPVAVKDYLETSLTTVMEIHKSEDKGDVLLFLTGEEEIEEACSRLRVGATKLKNECGPVNVIPLYSSLSPALQHRIFEDTPENGRKIIVSTNIAETSITIDGIVYVVDPGFSKQKVYNPRTRVESLLVSPISKASACQRAGRAGRTGHGVCYRLYTEETYNNNLRDSSYPEILRSNLSGLVLTLLKLGITDLVKFDYIDAPAPETLMRALETLHFLRAIDDDGGLTPSGMKMSSYPLDPQLSSILLGSAAQNHNTYDFVLCIVAMLSVPSCFIRIKDDEESIQARRSFTSEDGDHLTLLNVYRAYILALKDIRIGLPGIKSWCKTNFVNERSMQSAVCVHQQLKRIMKAQGDIAEIETDWINANLELYSVAIRKTLICGLFMQVAHLQKSGVYLTTKDQCHVMLHPSTCLSDKPQWVVYSDFVLTSQNYIRTVTRVRIEWLKEASPHYFTPSTFPKGETRRVLESLV